MADDHQPPPGARAATTCCTSVCEHGHVIFHLYDVNGKEFAFAILGPAQVLDLINETMDLMETHGLTRRAEVN